MSCVNVQETLIHSVVKRLMSDAPLAMLLSGGLDSSLIAAIAVRYLLGLPGKLSHPCCFLLSLSAAAWHLN